MKYEVVRLDKYNRETCLAVFTSLDEAKALCERNREHNPEGKFRVNLLLSIETHSNIH